MLIQDISKNIRKPDLFKPGQPNYHEGSRITDISWNRVVEHILASASENGKIVVWDLKASKSIFQFTEPQTAPMNSYFDDPSTQETAVRTKRTRMMWSPELPTRFVVANNDDQNPSFNVWDLRKTDYPVATFSNIHHSGILSISWCLTDPNLIVSAGKDERTVVTNFLTREMVLEFPSTDSCYDMVRWS